MRKDDSLDDHAVQSFMDFLRGLVVHGYPDVALRIGPPGDREEVNTLVDAWLSAGGRGGSAQAREAKLTAMRLEMQAVLGRCATTRDEQDPRLAGFELLFAAVEALALGRVYEEAYRYLLDRAEGGNLCQCLMRAAAALDYEWVDLRLLSHQHSRYDSGLSAVYSVMNERTVIYDDRLGAALGLLCRWHLQRSRQSAVPSQLGFMVGRAAPHGRDPSSGTISFCVPRFGPLHARSNLYASWIIDALAEDATIVHILRGSRHTRMRQLETALWVLGDDVVDQVEIGGRRAPKKCRRGRSDDFTQA